MRSLLKGKYAVKNMINIFLSFVFMIALFQNVRCTAVGFTAGALIDGSKPDEEMVPKEAWSEIEPGKDVRVFRSDSSVVAGSFLSVSSPTPGRSSVGDSVGSVLQVRANSQDVSIPHAGIQKVTTESSHHAKWYGMLIGLGVDVAIVAAAVALLQDAAEGM